MNTQGINFILNDVENEVLKSRTSGLLELLRTKGLPLTDTLKGKLLCVCRDKDHHEYIWTDE